MRTQTDRAPRDLSGIASDQKQMKIMVIYFQKTMVSLCSGARKTMKSHYYFSWTPKPMNTTPNLDICLSFVKSHCTFCTFSRQGLCIRPDSSYITVGPSYHLHQEQQQKAEDAA